MEKKVDIVVPIYNPGANWTGEFMQKAKELESVFSPTRLQFYIIDDGSKKNFSDNEALILAKGLNNALVIRHKINQGKGAAVRGGFKNTTSEHVIFTDIDFPFSHTSTLQIYKKLLEGNDIVCGVREEDYYAKVPLQRKIISLLFRLMNKYIFGLSVPDTQCGLKGFNRKGVEAMCDTRVSHFLFDLELLIIAKYRKLKVASSLVEIQPGTRLLPLSLKVIARETVSFIKIIMRMHG